MNENSENDDAWVRETSDRDLSIMGCALSKVLAARLGELEERLAVVLRCIRVIAEREARRKDPTFRAHDVPRA